MDAAHRFAKADGVGRDVLGQEVDNLHKTFRNDIMGSRYLCPLAKLAQRHLIHAGRAALTTLHLQHKPHQLPF